MRWLNSSSRIGADVNVKTKSGKTPLFRIKGTVGGKEVARLLIQKGADVNARDLSGATSLSWAALTDDYPMAQFLLQNGAHVNSKDNKGKTPLHWAILDNHKKMGDLLRQYGARE